MPKKDPVTSYARNAGMRAAAASMQPHSMPGAYVTLPNGKSPGEQTQGPAPHQVKGSYINHPSRGPGEQVGGLSAGATQPESGEKGKTGGSGEYPMDKKAAFEAGVSVGMELARMSLEEPVNNEEG